PGLTKFPEKNLMALEKVPCADVNYNCHIINAFGRFLHQINEDIQECQRKIVKAEETLILQGMNCRRLARPRQAGNYTNPELTQPHLPKAGHQVLRAASPETLWRNDIPYLSGGNSGQLPRLLM